MKIDTPFYSLVPKTWQANLEFRRKLLEMGNASKEDARNIWTMCARDPLFYINVMCWTHDPRLVGSSSDQPFITWKFQDELILAVLDAIVRGKTYHIDKSRDMGVTWCVLMCFLWLWQFHPNLTFLCTSWKEDLVDSKSPDSLFWKLDYVLRNQPTWLRPKFTRTFMVFQNDWTGSVITGESTNANIGIGGRFTAVFPDEFARVPQSEVVWGNISYSTACRLPVSTPKGTGNAFARLRKQRDEGIIDGKSLHWTLHPKHAKDLYYAQDGKPRSPWYDMKCREAIHPAEVSQDLDIDYLGSDYTFFASDLITRLQEKDARDPFMRGKLEFKEDGTPGRFVEDAAGPISLWMELEDGKPDKEDRYCIGADVSMGTGASDSVLAVVSKKSRSKVAEWSDNTTEPQDWGIRAAALCRWLNDAYLIWEAQGAGRLFGNAVLRCGYRGIFWRRKEEKITRDSTDIPGYMHGGESKKVLYGEYKRALEEGLYINRSFVALEQCRQYIYTKRGTIEHSAAVNAIDPAVGGKNHGDHVTADALCYHILDDVFVPVTEPEKIVPLGSLAWRRQLHEEEKETAGMRKAW